ncbi:hypothetical protein [Labrys neptuniae]
MTHYNQVELNGLVRNLKFAGTASAAFLLLLNNGLEPAHAGWLNDVGKGINRTWLSITKNPVEVLPVCWGSPQDCRSKPGDAKAGTATPPATADASAGATSICVQSDGQEGLVIAWFYPLRPAQYQQSALLVLKNMKQCADHTIAGPFLAANVLTVQPSQWSETVFPNGTRLWMLRGRIL